MNNFNRLSKKTVNKFIQNIVFIDDRAYENSNPNDQHDFDAKTITNVFSKDGKVCAVYQPIAEDELSSLIKVSKKSDVTVLDWQMNLQRSNLPSINTNDEDDDQDDDYRGIFTKKIIYELLSDNKLKNSIKLILIYTGEVNLSSITEDVYINMDEKYRDNFKIDESDSCSIISDSCKIMVIAKSNTQENPGRGQHFQELANKTVSYDALPKFITNEFTKLTSGLLSNFAMESLSEIRNNFNHIINLFSKNLDSAYLAHKVLLPNTQDANELLVDILGSTFTSIIRYKGLNKYLDDKRISIWIENNVIEENYKIDNSNQAQFFKSHELLKKLIVSHHNVEDKFHSAINHELTNKIAKNNINKIISNSTITLFTKSPDHELTNNKFANLCQHRNIIPIENHRQSLTSGTIVQSTYNNTFYICIQQKCDSVRLENDKPRRFLFLSLTEINSESSSKKFDFLTPSGIKLRVDEGTYSLRTVKFQSLNNTVETRNIRGKKYFYPYHYSKKIYERFLFIVELQDMYTQQIIENYSASLSRIGLDKPEWVRRLK